MPVSWQQQSTHTMLSVKNMSWLCAYIQVLLFVNTAYIPIAQEKQQTLKHLKRSIGPVCKRRSASLTLGPIKLPPNIRYAASLTCVLLKLVSTTVVSHMARFPTNMSNENGCIIPRSFITAIYRLSRQIKLKKQNKVLRNNLPALPVSKSLRQASSQGKIRRNKTKI